jgi:hypothetical protein
MRTTTYLQKSVLGLCALLATASLAGAPEALPTLDDLRARLHLSDVQYAQIEPLFERRRAELQRTRVQLEGATSRSAKRSVLRGAKQQQETFVSQVDATLDPEQKAEWDKVRAEMRDILKDQWQAKREAQGAL